MADAEAARGERLVLSGSSGASNARGTCGTHCCGRARRARRMRAGRAGRRGTPGVCRRRRSSAYVAGVVREHGATGVSAPGRVRGGVTGVDASGRVRRLGHGRDDDDASCINSGDRRAHGTSQRARRRVKTSSSGVQDDGRRQGVSRLRGEMLALILMCVVSLAASPAAATSGASGGVAESWSAWIR
ncbi:hypothetical protein VPH35_113258 [Triticum aestivum]